MKTIFWIVGSLLIASAAPAFADETQIALKQAEGHETVEANCAACHSLDYIQMNSPVQDEKGWTATVTKMVKVMGAPIEEADQKKIIAYLAANYGK